MSTQKILEAVKARHPGLYASIAKVADSEKISLGEAVIRCIEKVVPPADGGLSLPV